MEKIDLIYTLYVGNHQLCDTSNICTIVDKFFSDVLVSEGLIEDDNYTVVLSASYRYGGIDKGNGHVKVTIQPVGSAGLQESQTNIDEPTVDEPDQQREEPMRITLLQGDIEAAIRAHVTSNVSLANGKEVQMKFSMKRGENGLQAEINIVDSNSQGSAPVELSTGSGAPATEANTTTAQPAGKGSKSIFGSATAPQNEAEVQSAQAETATA
jgi:hypothetical protein